MTLLKAASSQLPPNAPLPGTDVGDLFRTRVPDPVNYIMHTTGSTYWASLAAEYGFKKSTDGMDTWSSVFGADATYPWGVAFFQPQALGSYAAGTIWARRLSPYSETAVYYTINEGQSYTTGYLAATAIHSTGDRWLQESQFGYLINVCVNNTGSAISVNQWSSFGYVGSVLISSSYRMSGVNENAAGGFILIASYNPSVSVDNLIGRYSTNGGLTWASQGSAISVGTPVDFYGRQDHHITDNEFGVALLTDTLGLAFFTVDDGTGSSFTQRWALNDPKIVSISHVNAIQGRVQGWAIVVNTATTSRLYLSNPSGYATFDLALEVPLTKVGGLTNVIEIS